MMVRTALPIALALGGSLSAFAASSARFEGLSNRVITPNGDGLNDNAVFLLFNPQASGGTVRVYDLRGHRVAEIGVEAAVNPRPAWDARSGGGTVPSGVYIFVIKIDRVVKTGALVVLR